jgi:hypothetical protein
MLDSLGIAGADELDVFPLNEKTIYLHDHDPATRTMGSCRCGAYQMSVAEVTTALDAGRRELVLPATSAWRPAPGAPVRLT